MMTADPVCATPVDSVQMVARLMKEHHCGALPVIRGDHDRFLLGIVTDRDLALRIIAPGKPPDTPVGEVMSAGVSCCLPDARVEHVRRS
jgi:CBS domain-containing protein